jgi:DNA-binding response OmpR family regulator
MPLRPDMKTLFVSGHRHDALDRHGLSDGDLTLPKPFLAAELLRRVQTLLGQGTRPVQ